MFRKKILIKIAGINGQAVTEYIIVASLIMIAVISLVQAFGVGLDAAFGLAIYNMAYNYK